MKYILKTPFALAAVLALTGCFGSESSSEDSDNKTNDTEYNAECQTVPTAASAEEMALVYEFDNQFGEGSSVSYSGQVTRHVLLAELVAKIKGLANPGAVAVTAAELKAFYEAGEETVDAELTFAPGDLPILGEPTKIAELSSSAKNLEGKTSTDVIIDDNPSFKGKTAPELVNMWLETLAENSQTLAGTPEVLLDDKNRDLSQLLEKLLHGAMSLDQAANKYLADLGDNTVNVEGQSYTDAEHHYDEAFGYFGAARDYLTYSDDALASKNDEKPYKDSDEDGFINLNSEVNFGISQNAGKRNRIDCQVNLSRDAFLAFHAGRKALADGGAESDDAVQTAIIDALGAWEKILAATALHYANDTKADQEAYDENDLSQYSVLDHAKHWSELKGFAWALQYNNNKIISNGELKELQDLIGDAPAQVSYDSEEGKQVIANLIAARELLGEVYGFEDYLVQNW